MSQRARRARPHARAAGFGGRTGSVLATRLCVLVCVALALGGCASNQERSAQLAKLAHARELAHPTETAKGIVVSRLNPHVRVLSAVALHDQNGAAAVVTLRNLSAKPLRDAPIAITVTGAGGTVLYRNDTPGLDSTLVSVPLLQPGARTTWIDDQVQATGAPSGVSARVGEATAARGPLPRLSIAQMHGVEESGSGASAEGSVVNHSSVTQQKLVVYALARRAGRIVAAGRAVLPEARAHASTPFQIFFIGDAKGAKLEVSAPATTLG